MAGMRATPVNQSIWETETLPAARMIWHGFADGAWSRVVRNPDYLRQFARSMRREPVSNERALWKLVRDRRLEGMKFRRQVPIGRYIVDFVCFPHRLIVEADGPTHEGGAHDVERDAWFESQGFTVLRFANRTIETQPQAVLDAIAAAAARHG